jgi:hypothetical protein
MDDTPSDGPLGLPIKARENAVEALGLHFANEHLDLAEFERRLDMAYAARSQAELAALLSDLPALPGGQVVPVQAKPPAVVKKRELMFNLLGGSERRGRWSPPRRLVITALMGGVVLDFREAAFATEEVEVTVVSLVASKVEILVPPTLRVEMGGVPIIGAFEHRSEGASPEPSAPLLRVGGVALLGGVEVKVLSIDEEYRPDW